MTVREARPDDLEALLGLYEQLHGETMPEKNSRLTALWQKILRDEDQHVLLGEEAGLPVSSCVVTVIPNLTHGQRPYALVENVVTHEAYRGRGFATACLDKARELAASENCYKMMLLTGSKKESTLRFYEHAGYNRQDKTAFVQWLEP
ncbi:MAG: GNAT family N-acetyltransferase [Eubacteriales bacterium]|nr:GNAT family N-acetyltransferase [Eubacteriales bacterium]